MDPIHPIVPRQPDIVPVEPVRRAWIDPDTRERRREERARRQRDAETARPRQETATKRRDDGDRPVDDGPHVDVRA